MKTKFLFIAILCVFISLVTLSSCGRNESPCSDEEPSKHIEYKLSAEEQSKIPHEGTDTLVFVSNTGDTATLYGSGRKNYMDKESVNRNSNPDCPFYDYNYYESVEFIFSGNDPLFNKLYCRFYVNDKSMYHFGIVEYTVNRYDFSYDGLTEANDTTKYGETVDIDGELYKCYLFRVYKQDGKIQKMYYNYKYGLLKFELTDGTSWFRLMK